MDLEFDFSSLPSSVITTIIKKLKFVDFKNASIVCKSWYAASAASQISKNLVLSPGTEEYYPEVCKSYRKYGTLKLRNIHFNKIDESWIELCKKFCPFIHKLHIVMDSSNECSIIELQNLLKILQLTTRLESIAFSGCGQINKLPGLFPVDYDREAKAQIVKNLSGIKNVIFEDFHNMPFIADLAGCITNIKNFRFVNSVIDFHKDTYTYKFLFKIFANTDVSQMTHLDLNLFLTIPTIDDFLMRFTQIKNLNLKSFRISLNWNWRNGMYNDSLFGAFIKKLQSLEELFIGPMRQEQVTIICETLVNLKELNCYLWQKDHHIAELSKLKKIEKLHCHFPPHYDEEFNLAEIDKFFKHKFEYLQVFDFGPFVTEKNLIRLCENHPNLIELRLNSLLTRYIEPIFQYLTKLRIVYLIFINDDEYKEEQEIYNRRSKQVYEYKISRLQDLEVFRLNELVNGIHEEDVEKLKKLKKTNLPKLFREKRNKALA